MSSPVTPPNLVLIRRLADGKVEWIRLEGPTPHVPATPDASYTLVDRAAFEAPQKLVAERVGQNLVLEVDGNQTLVIDGFFDTANATFYPTTNIAGGAGPFSGTTLTADSPILAGSPAGEQVLWSAEPLGAGSTAAAATVATAGAATSAAAATGGASPMLWVGLGAGGLGLAALAGGGGGSGGGESGGGPTPTPTPDTTPPTITSAATATPIAENSGANQTVYTATATDANAVTYSLKAGGDAASFAINARTGVVTLTGNPDFEAKASYAFTVVATDAASNSSELAVSLAITNVADTPVTITSGATATAISENSGAGQTVYTAVASATTGSAVTYSLAAGGDASAFTIDANTGVVKLSGNPNFEVKPNYSFTIVATDAANNSATQAVGLSINNLDEVAPTITSGGTATAINENSGAGQIVYTVTSTDTGDISTGSTTYSLKPGADAAAFTINASSGAVMLTANPNQEAKANYSFTVVARDAANNSTEGAVTLAINDLDDSPPTITSGGTAPAINENSGAGQIVYTVTSTDNGDISSGVTTYSLKQVTDFASFSINSSTGAVTLIANPDDEAKGSYNFTVVATDAAGNFSERAVSLGINDLDEVAPTITSSATANPITENSGAGQVVYTVTSTDTGDISTGNTTYSLRAVNDSSAFSINSTTGAVTLIANPDFETKPSYNFTVVATDAANHSSERAVSLAINNVVDETPPSIDHVALSGSTGSQNGILNAGDTVSVTVTMTENTTVNTSGGTPSIELSFNPGNRVDATYVSGSGTPNLVFQYTIQPGDEDDNGISLRANRLQLNGGSIADTAGNVANLNYGALNNDAGFIVDTRAPTLSSSSPDDNENNVSRRTDIVLNFNDDMLAASGNITLSNLLDTRTFSVTDPQVSINGSQVTINPSIDLLPNAEYSVRIDAGALTDRAGNPFAGINNDTTLNFQVDPNPFSFSGPTQAASLDSGRLFETATSDGVNILADTSEASSSPSASSAWAGSAALTSDARISLAGDGSASGLAATGIEHSIGIGEFLWQFASHANEASADVPLADPVHIGVVIPGATGHGGDSHANALPPMEMPVIVVTSQGLS